MLSGEVKMKIIGLVGLGRVGLKALDILTKRKDLYFYGFDIDPSKKGLLAKYDNVDFIKISDIKDLRSYLSKIDLLMSAVPSREGYKIATLASEVCVDLVDVSFISEDPYTLNRAFIDCDKIYIPDAGYAPGYSNIVAGYLNKKFNGLKILEIYVGGIPTENIPPLGYFVTWSAEDLLEEYTRPARIVINNKIVYVDPLDKIGEVSIPGLGSFQWFYSDGLRTMLRNISAEIMFEATLRWHGHLDKIRVLRELGFLDRDAIDIDTHSVEIIRLTSRIFEKKLRKETKDMAILYVKALGKNYEKYEELTVVYGEVGDYATPRFTAIIFASIAELLIERDLKRRGVLAPEELGDYIDFFRNKLVQYQPSKNYIIMRFSMS